MFAILEGHGKNCLQNNIMHANNTCKGMEIL